MKNYVLVRREEILEKLKDSSLPFKIHEDIQVMNKAEIHKKAGDLWLCLEGEPTFIVGGELIDPWEKDENELRAENIKDGDEFVLKAGDWLWIPPNCPHQHGCKDTARLVIIKVPLN